MKVVLTTFALWLLAAATVVVLIIFVPRLFHKEDIPLPIPIQGVYDSIQELPKQNAARAALYEGGWRYYTFDGVVTSVEADGLVSISDRYPSRSPLIVCLSFDRSVYQLNVGEPAVIQGKLDTIRDAILFVECRVYEE